MKTCKFILPLIVSLAISASSVPVAAGKGAYAVVSKARVMPQQPGNVPPQAGTGSVQPVSMPNNNVGNGTFINGGNGTFVNGGNGTFIQPSSPAQPGSPAQSGSPVQSGSPAVTGQVMTPNNVAGQNITGQNLNQNGVSGTRQQYNQQGWMTNRPPLQTNDSHLQPWMTNHPPLPLKNPNTPP